MKRFSGILQQYELIYVVDGFAGPGRYEDGEYGSPLLAARLAASLERRERRYGLRCINVEIDAEVFKNLCDATASLAKYVRNYPGAFQDSVLAIVEYVGRQPTLFFLDPFGLKGLEWRSLQPILDRALDSEVKTELLIRYDAYTAARLAGFTESGGKQKDANIQTILDVFGMNNIDQWKAYVANYGIDLTGLTEAYQDRLRGHFDYVLRIPIRKRDNQLKYHLIFATRSLKGVVAMNDTLYEVEDMREEDLASWRQRSVAQQLPLEEFVLSEEGERLAQLNTLKQAILNILPVGADIKRGDLRAQVALKEDYFGQFSGGHFTAVFKGGRPRNIKRPEGFEPFDESRMQFIARTPGVDEAVIRRLR